MEKRPFIRGKIHRTDRFVPVVGGGGDRPKLPPVEPSRHAKRLIEAIDRASAAARRRTADRERLATRHLLAVTPTEGYELPSESLRDKLTRVVGVDPDSQTVILDALDPGLGALVRKVKQFADPTKNSGKTGHPRNEPLVAPIDDVRLATAEDLFSPRVKAAAPRGQTPIWFELACRGGYDDALGSDVSRRQIHAACARHGIRSSTDAFVAAERTSYYVWCTIRALDSLVDATDCIFEIDLPSTDLARWLALQSPRESAATVPTPKPPSSNAPSIAILDSGIDQRHRLLRPVVRAAVSVLPGIASGEDTQGHGTEMAGIAAFGELSAKAVPVVSSRCQSASVLASTASLRAGTKSAVYRTPVEMRTSSIAPSRPSAP